MKFQEIDLRLPLLLAGCLAVLSGCGVMHMNAPAGTEVRLLAQDEPASIRLERHAWFKWWGAEPMNPDEVNASDMIREAGLKEARIQMTNTFVDGIYSIVPGVFGFPRRTLIVEGNRTLSTPPAATGQGVSR